MTNEHSDLSVTQVDELILDSQRLRAKVEMLQEDVACHDRLLEIMREHAAALGIKYGGDQEYLVSVKAKVERLEAAAKEQT